MEDPHERTVMLFCGLLPFIFFIPIYFIMYHFMSRYYIKKERGIEMMREKPLPFGSQRFSCIMSWVILSPLGHIALLYD